MAFTFKIKGVSSPMNPGQLLSVAVPIASVGIALLAILVCMLFFLASAKTRQDTREAAKAINTNVQRLEKLVDQIFNETFTVMRDIISSSFGLRNSKPDGTPPPAVNLDSTVSTMAALEGRLKELESALKRLAEHQQAITEVVQSTTTGNGRGDDTVRSDPQEGSREGGAQTPTRLRIDLLQCLADLKNHRNPLRASDVLQALQSRGHSPPQVVQELECLEDEGVISLSDELPMGSNTIIKITE